MIRLRFVTSGNSAISKMIQFAQYGFWASHTEAVMPDGMLLGAHIDGGVMERPTGYDLAEFTHQQFVDLPADDGMVGRFNEFLRAQVGKPYDVSAIAAFVARRDWQERDSWFCSELQAAALVDCGWFASPLATQFNHITPRDLLLIVSGRVNTAAETGE